MQKGLTFLVWFIPRYLIGFVISDFILNFIFCLCYQHLGVNAASQGVKVSLLFSLTPSSLGSQGWKMTSSSLGLEETFLGGRSIWQCGTRAPRLEEKTFPRNLYRGVRHEDAVWLLSGGENGIFKPGSLLPPTKIRFYCYTMKEASLVIQWLKNNNKNLPAGVVDMDFHPWSRKIPLAVEQLSHAP